MNESDSHAAVLPAPLRPLTHSASDVWHPVSPVDAPLTYLWQVTAPSDVMSILPHSTPPVFHRRPDDELALLAPRTRRAPGRPDLVRPDRCRCRIQAHHTSAPNAWGSKSGGGNAAP